jgi:hypothetical protein
MELEGETWYLFRRNAQPENAHPATDNAAGTDSYGTGFNNPTGTDTFSVKYSTSAWTRILFATGNLAKWVILERI